MEGGLQASSLKETWMTRGQRPESANFCTFLSKNDALIPLLEHHLAPGGRRQV